MASVAADPNAREGTTRERLLQVAIEMFGERGYAATGVDALCRRAGVAKTGLYWEFQSKGGLLRAVIERVIGDWVREIHTAASQAGAPREKLDMALAAMRQHVMERPEAFRVIIVVIAERSQIDEDARRALRTFFDNARDALLKGIQDALEPALPPRDLQTVADLFLAMIEGVFLRVQVYQKEADVDALFSWIRSAVLLMVRELVARKAGHSTLVGSVMDLAKPMDDTAPAGLLPRDE